MLELLDTDRRRMGVDCPAQQSKAAFADGGNDLRR